MTTNDLLTNQECSCFFCKTTGTVGQKITDSSDMEWHMFYCGPESDPGSEVEDFTVICLNCANEKDEIIRIKYANWFKQKKFLPTLYSQMEKNSKYRVIKKKTKPNPDDKSGKHLALYQEKYSSMTVDERENEASHQTGDLLLALCHDYEVRVVKRVLENHSSGLEHARLIAKLHKNSQGLEFIVRNSKLISDNRVQNNLLKNSILSEAQIRAILNSKTLSQSWTIASSHDFPSKNKQIARKIVKEKFIQAAQEDRAKFIYDTEGRILILIHDIPFGDQTVAILCKKTYHSLLLIQNLAKCGRTPAKLLRHLEIQNVVKHNKAVKNLIRRHANYPKTHSRNKK
ncbi:hypothetical protein ACFL2U_03765 [Patescibacteria group bacterium]